MEFLDYKSSEKVRKFIHCAHQEIDAHLPTASEDGIPVVILEANGKIHVLLGISERFTQDEYLSLIHI